MLRGYLGGVYYATSYVSSNVFSRRENHKIAFDEFHGFFRASIEQHIRFCSWLHLAWLPVFKKGSL